MTSQDPLLEQLSKTKQGKLNKEINKHSIKYITNELLPLIQETIEPICSCSVDDNDQHNINIEYPSALLECKYIQYT